MAKSDDWIICPECEEEFSIIVSSNNKVEYCPLCGEYLVLDEVFEELDPDDMEL